MPYITREDGERFIIPSYRDVITEKKLSLLRKEILALSASYGEYVTLQRKGANQYEVAFSPDPGYLLGETVWHYFKRPPNLIYCEEIPNTSEAILVIVREGIVYLDGNFPMDTIADELVSVRTQHIQFDIYIYGDVPLSETPEEGKFAFDEASIKSFTILDKPVFPLLPTLKSFQLQLVEVVLKSKDFSAFPVKKLLWIIVLLLFIWGMWELISNYKKEIVLPEIITTVTNPYQSYLTALNSPNPARQIEWVAKKIWLLTTIPGWYADSVDFSNGVMHASVKSRGARTNLLFEWAAHNNSLVEVAPDGFVVTSYIAFPNRPIPNTINRLNDVVAVLIDYISYILPGNNLGVTPPISRGSYFERQLTINFADITASTLSLIGDKLQNLPLVLIKVTVKITNDTLSGTITLKALGS